MTPEFVLKVVGTLAALSAASWQAVEVFQPLFAKITKDEIRWMIKKVCAGIVAWGAAWAFGIPAINAFGYNIPAALDAILVGLLATGGAAVFNVIFDLLKIWKDYSIARVSLTYTNDEILRDKNLG